MKPYFAVDSRKDRLQKIAADWIGTPYLHCGDSKNGTDCAKFIALILVEIGLLSRLEKGIIYSRDWFLHGGCCDLIVESFARHGERYLSTGLSMELFPYCNRWLILPGDILFFSTGEHGRCNHAGLYLGDDKFVHCLERKGVYIADFSLHWRPKAKKLFRIYENGN